MIALFLNQNFNCRIVKLIMRILAYKVSYSAMTNFLNIITLLKNHEMAWKFHLKATDYHFGITLRQLIQ